MPAPDKKNRFDFDIPATLARLQSWPQRQVEHWRTRLNNLHQSNFDMGCDFSERGALRDAIFRFKMATYLKPNFPMAWYNLGVCYMRNGERSAAKTALKRALSQRPNFAEAAYMLATLDASSLPAELRPTRMPEGMMEGFFAQVAPAYDQIEAQNQYQGAQQTAELLRPHLPATSGLNVVDLGCGSGVLGRLWRKVSDRLVGVDVTPAMVQVARAARTPEDTPLYDAVLQADIRTLSEDAVPNGQADVVLLVNTAQFLGDLQHAFWQATRLLKVGGLVLVTVEPYAGQGYGVVPATGRFGHGDAYVQATAAAMGLQTVSQQKVALYPNMQVTAHLFRRAQAA